MPSERRGTVTDDFGGYIKRLQGSVEWKGDRAGTIRTAIAKVSSLVVNSRKVPMINGFVS
jgi:ribosomal protein L1